MPRNKFKRRHISAYRFLKSIKRSPMIIIDLDQIPQNLDVPKLIEMLNKQPINTFPLTQKKQ